MNSIGWFCWILHLLLLLLLTIKKVHKQKYSAAEEKCTGTTNQVTRIYLRGYLQFCLQKTYQSAFFQYLIAVSRSHGHSDRLLAILWLWLWIFYFKITGTLRQTATPACPVTLTVSVVLVTGMMDDTGISKSATNGCPAMIGHPGSDTVLQKSRSTPGTGTCKPKTLSVVSSLASWMSSFATPLIVTWAVSPFGNSQGSPASQGTTSTEVILADPVCQMVSIGLDIYIYIEYITYHHNISHQFPSPKHTGRTWTWGQGRKNQRTLAF